MKLLYIAYSHHQFLKIFLDKNYLKVWLKVALFKAFNYFLAYFGSQYCQHKPCESASFYVQIFIHVEYVIYHGIKSCMVKIRWMRLFHGFGISRVGAY